jgi:disulfide bond formation protein DsbB
MVWEIFYYVNNIYYILYVMESMEKKDLNLIIFITILSGAALCVAYIAEYHFGLKPCVLCMYERIPYFTVVISAVISLFIKKARPLIIKLCGVALLIGALISVYHVGVEQHIFEGTRECNANTKPVTLEQLKAELLSDKPPSCSEAAFTFLAISFAGWNSIFSLFLCIVVYLRLKNDPE